MQRGWLRTVGILVIAGALLQVPHPSFAQEEPPAEAEAPKSEREKEREKLEQQRARSVDQATAKKLNEIFELYNTEKYAEARGKVSGLSMDRLSPYEQSRVYQIVAAIDLREEKYAQAQQSLDKALASGGLNDQETDSVRFQLVQIYMAQERWKEGIDAWKKWAASALTPPKSAEYYTLAIAYYQSGDLKSALDPAEKAVSMATGKPLESWIQLLLALRIEREEFKLAAPLLKRLIGLAPAKKTYWVQLAAVNAQLGNYAEASQAMQLAYVGGLLKEERDVRRVAELAVQIEIPYRAAKVLTAEIDKNTFKPDSKALEFLSNCWIQAQEYKKAVDPLKAAAAIADSGDLFVRLGEVYSQNEEWSNVADAIRRGIDKGKLKNPGSAQLLLGIALYSQKKPNEAKPWFQRALNQESSRKQAESWLKQLEVEGGGAD